ncbi:MAG: alcohol dehydrogenase [Planctomycetes bacterium SCN 63-9]|nr:MAG: alcohol dehydrogenase [Planctomycetes bacterium SCN 63-9]
MNSALWYREFGPPEEVLTLETRESDPREPRLIRVRMTLSPINPSDLIPITGAYRHRVMPPRVAGYEGVGTVIEAPESSRELLGRRVLPLRGEGTWQSFVDCDPAWVVPVPDDIDDSTAARAYINPLAALLMLKAWNPAGKRVVVTAAGSTCAGLLAQWAMASDAREVVGIHRSPEHRLPLSQQGIIPVDAGDAPEVAARSKTADLIFDAVGGLQATAMLKAMRRDASFVSYGLLAGELYVIDAVGPRPARFHIRDHLEGVSPETWRHWFREIWPHLRQGRLPQAECFPLSKWREALALFRQPGRRTKPVLDLG